MTRENLAVRPRADPIAGAALAVTGGHLAISCSKLGVFAHRAITSLCDRVAHPSSEVA